MQSNCSRLKWMVKSLEALSSFKIMPILLSQQEDAESTIFVSLHKTRGFKIVIFHLKKCECDIHEWLVNWGLFVFKLS